MELNKEKILILDFGAQYAQLIARRVRELKVYCEIHPFNLSLEKIKRFNPKGIIFSGSPASVYDNNAPYPEKEIFTLGIPVLGICYGMQYISHFFGGNVEKSQKREYGRTEVVIHSFDDIFKGFDDIKEVVVWMSHGDKIEKLPKDFTSIAVSNNSPFAAFRHNKLPLFGVQFHPEVAHTPLGKKMINNFLFAVCQVKPLWNMKNFIQLEIERIKKETENSNVICALSGGVDSTVTAVIIHRAIGERLTCIFVNNGLLREEEAEKVLGYYKEKLKLPVKFVDAEEIFLDRLKGVDDPEQKRKIIGNEFIYLFEREAQKIKDVKFLAQGTLYPDVIESVSFKGPSATIKSHHNVGGLPEKMNLKLIEPLRELFKDEVRLLGKELGIDDEILGRHPFPGPGLAIRVIGEVTFERLEVLRKADSILIEEIRKAKLYNKIWQAFAVLLPIKTVGVMGDERSYENVIAVRAVTSLDGMTADWFRFSPEILERISNRIINEVKGVNRVVYDISSKPPGTIEWE